MANRVLIGYEPVQVESEGELEAARAAAVLTPPLSLEGGLAAELRPANLARRVLSLFGNVSPGSDLSHFQVRLLFPKAQ
jgi:oxysterol-binding protein-related protein 8